MGKRVTRESRTMKSLVLLRLSAVVLLAALFLPLCANVLVPALPASASDLGEAVDNTFLEWTTGVDAEWFGQMSVYYYDGDAAQSGAIGNGQSSSVETTVMGSGIVRFHWKVSSESEQDYLRFYIDDAEKASISGEVDWQQKAYPIPSGTRTLRWQYTKDVSVSSGSDCGWLDKVEVITIGEAVDNTSLGWTTGGSTTWLGVTLVWFPQLSAYYYDGDAAQSGPVDSLWPYSWLQTTVAGPAWVSFYWKISSNPDPLLGGIASRST